MVNVLNINKCADKRLVEKALDNLPPEDTTRWVASRKAAVVKAVDVGALTEIEVCERYDLSEEELAIWRESLALHGKNALLVTKLQHFRNMNGE